MKCLIKTPAFVAPPLVSDRLYRHMISGEVILCTDPVNKKGIRLSGGSTAYSAREWNFARRENYEDFVGELTVAN